MTTHSSPEFFQQPVLQFNSQTCLWRLVQDYCFIWMDKGVCRKFYIQSGMEYDKASVPRPLWGIARTDGPWEAASLMHDALYRYLQHGGTMPPGMLQEKLPGGQWVDTKKFTRTQADNLLEFAGHLGGASKFEAGEYKWAVRLAPENWFKGF